MGTKFGRRGFFGMLGEAQARRLLKEMGYIVLPVSLIENGGAPLLESQVRAWIAPDILAAHGASPSWLTSRPRGEPPGIAVAADRRRGAN
jgi:hypothetical protein